MAGPSKSCTRPRRLLAFLMWPRAWAAAQVKLKDVVDFVSDVVAVNAAVAATRAAVPQAVAPAVASLEAAARDVPGDRRRAALEPLAQQAIAEATSQVRQRSYGTCEYIAAVDLRSSMVWICRPP
jgi:hypothetical protein